MLKKNRSLRVAAAAAMAASVPGALAAQDNTTVGPPQLRNFQLNGQQTVAPAPQTAPPPRPAPVTVQAPPPVLTGGTTPRQAAPAPAAAARPAEATPVRTTARKRPTETRPAAPPANVIALPPAAPRALAPPPSVTPPAAAPVPVAPIAAPPTARPAPVPAAPEDNGTLWPLFGALAALALAAAGAWFWLRRRRSLDDRDVADRGALADVLLAGDSPRPAALPEAKPEPVRPAAEPVPAMRIPEAVAAAPAAEASRPWLQLDIKPERAAATEADATINFMLVITNGGDAPARNIRIDTRMFNASETDNLAAFLKGPIRRHSGSPHVTLPPGETLELEAVAGMKKEEVRAIALAGRQIFVPTLAINVAYDWAETGEGRTSKSWVVGRESAEAAKMGPFRLDLGPRIYRSVGRRDAQLVMV